MISKIDDALRRIEDGSYGYCEDGEPIGLEPIGSPSDRDPSVEAQERHERRERGTATDRDRRGQFRRRLAKRP